MALDNNIIIDGVSIIIVLVLIVSGFKSKRESSLDARILKLMVVCVLIVLAIDIPGLALDGADFNGAREMLWLVDSAYWLFHAVYGWLWLMYIDAQLWQSRDHLKRNIWFYSVTMFAAIMLILLNIKTGWIFNIDSANRYTKGSAYFWSLIPYYAYIAQALCLTAGGYLYRKDAKQKHRCLLLMIYMFLPVCGMILEIFAYGVSWVWPMMALALLMACTVSQQQYMSDERLREAEAIRKSVHLEKELIDSDIKIMLSQIQPEFLYDSLSVIRSLCESNPSASGKAMKCFSDFLRCNMDSLTMDKTISFENELNHTKNYLALEKLRLGDAVQIEYDIRTTMFRLPALTLQQIVENAVRYGFTGRESGGVVKISAWETDDAFIATIKDNGLSIAERNDDGKTDIGIANVRNRLQSICGGSLCIDDIDGEGTVATITLPKGGDG